MRTIDGRVCGIVVAGLLSAALLSGNGWAYLGSAAPHPTSAAPNEWTSRAAEAHRDVWTRWTEAGRVGSRGLQVVLHIALDGAGPITE